MIAGRLVKGGIQELPYDQAYAQKNRTVRGVLGGLVGLVGLSAVAGLLVAASVTPVLTMTGLAGAQH